MQDGPPAEIELSAVTGTACEVVTGRGGGEIEEIGIAINSSTEPGTAVQDSQGVAIWGQLQKEPIG